MRNSIATKIFISFLLVSLLPIAALIAYNDWVNRHLVYSTKIEELKNQAGKLAKPIGGIVCFKSEIRNGTSVPRWLGYGVESKG